MIHFTDGGMHRFTFGSILGITRFFLADDFYCHCELLGTFWEDHSGRGPAFEVGVFEQDLSLGRVINLLFD